MMDKAALVMEDEDYDTFIASNPERSAAFGAWVEGCLGRKVDASPPIVRCTLGEGVARFELYDVEADRSRGFKGEDFPTMTVVVPAPMPPYWKPTS